MNWVLVIEFQRLDELGLFVCLLNAKLCPTTNYVNKNAQNGTRV